MSSINERIIHKINKEIGTDINKLHRSKPLVKNVKQQIVCLEEKLSFDNKKVGSSYKSALNLSDKGSFEIKAEVIKIDSFNLGVTNSVDVFQSVLKGVSDNLDKIRNLNLLLEYFKLLKDIESISNELKFCVDGKDESKTVGLYLALCGDVDSNNILERLQGVNASHLETFGLETSFYWHAILKEKFSKDFEMVLKTMKWPYLGQSLELFSPSKEILNKLSTVSEYLFLLKIPGDQNSGCIKITPSIIYPPISLPIQLLVKPFRQRFLYHFYGTRQTNRLDKPEWYFTQILSWIRDNQLCVSQNLQSAAIKAGFGGLNVRLEFVNGLVQLAIEKLCHDIEDISKDESLFSHLLDEGLSFEQELKQLAKINYLSSFPTAISVFTQAQYLVKWLSIEEKFSTDKMDAMLTSGTPWECLDPGNNEDLKIPKCSDQFIRLLDAIKERYSGLPQPGHQLQFLHLQLELIESFRRRLVQLHNSTIDNVSTTKILNAINYLTSVLREWGENVHYLHLHAALVGSSAEEIVSVFDKAIEELEHWQRKLIKELSSKIVDEIKAKSMPYRHDNWVSIPEQNVKEPFMLSITAGEMFQVMVTSLHNLESELSANLFSIVLRLIAQKLDDFFIDSMIMNTRFTSGGTRQFQFDMTRNLFALFGQYARRPELLFKKIQNACILLNLPLGSSILLHQTIKGELNLERTANALKEVGVTCLSPVMAVDILERRVDICM